MVMTPRHSGADLQSGALQTARWRSAYSLAVALIRRFAPDLLAAIFAGSAVLHLARPSLYEALIPPFLPAPGVIIAISGLAELVCAIGLVRRDRWAGPTSAAVLVAVFPGNVWFAFSATADPTTDAWVVAGAWLRLPLQAPLLWAALQARRLTGEGSSADTPNDR
jgi:uncharacterized membrane protein